jgi:mRNA interferase YafQ
MYSISFSTKFKRDFKLCKKRGYDISKLEEVIRLLQKNGKLPSKYKPHLLKGSYDGLWECHIKPDWLLVWLQDDYQLTLLFTNTGTHSDLF